jgi:hypothetical protein
LLQPITFLLGASSCARIKSGPSREQRTRAVLSFDADSGEQTPMFHTYVLAFSGKVIDFDRASFLMDHDLVEAAKKAMHEEKTFAPRWDADYGAQWIWDYYVQRHYEKYGEDFVPNVNPDWDSYQLPRRARLPRAGAPP